MFFRELLETAQSVALAGRLNPTEVVVYEKVCREYSKTFHTELMKVYELPFEFVVTQIYADRLDNWSEEEQRDDFLDLYGSLADPDYDANKERAHREEMRKILEEEQLRLQEGRAIHPSLENKKAKEEKKLPPKEIPKSGGINMDLIKQLQNRETEG
jgi:hypothetical protein